MIRNQVKEKIHKSLDELTTITQRDMEHLRTQELLMRSLVDLDERSRYEPKGSREDMWGKEMIKRLQKASSMDGYPIMQQQGQMSQTS